MTYTDRMDMEYTERIREEESVAQDMMYHEEQTRYKDFLELVKENPTLPVVPRVDSEVVAEEGYSWWWASFNGAYLDEMVDYKDRRYSKEDDEEDLMETLIEEFMDDEGLTDDDYGDYCDKVALERFNALPWRKVIAVRISLPEELEEL